jgi:2-amino-4-hydroxy-6-hydroxymethyldihydropteridine diphosphokinase
MRTAYIGLGSNLGDRQQHIYSAVESLHRHRAVSVQRCSSLYETAPVGLLDQPYFLNMVIAVQSSLRPSELLDLLLETEQRLGRVRDIRWGPRTIDLDLLLYGDVDQHDDHLELPHPRMKERAFVLIPLLEIGGPEEVTGYESFLQALESIDRKEDVHLWLKTNWRSEFGRFAN